MKDDIGKSTSIADQVKAAEKEKYLAEAAKALAEKEKVEYELSQSKKFFNIRTIWSIIIGVGFLSFFISYTLIPISQRDNILLSTRLAKESDSLYIGGKILKEKLTILKQLKDSLIKQSDSLSKSKYQNTQLNKEYKNLIKELLKASNELVEVSAIYTGPTTTAAKPTSTSTGRE